MKEPHDKEPGLGRVDEVDDSTGNVAPLRTDSADPDPEPSFSAANGLTSRDRPTPSESDVAEGDHEPGASLRRAREVAGLDTATLASRIHLGRGTLEDLEANRFHHMPPAYVRGYLRSCARELGADVTPWIQAFERHGLEDPELRAVATPSARGPRRRRGRGIYWLALLLLLVLLGLGVYAWNERTESPVLPSLNLGDAQDVLHGLTSGDDASTQDASAAEEASSQEGVDSEAPASSSEASESAEAVSPEPVVAPPPSGEAEAAPTASSEPTFSAEELTELVVSRAAESEDAGAAADTQEALSPLAAAEASPSASANDGGGALLVLEFSETSWVEIRDAADDVVLTGVLSQGDREEVRLELPGRVVLGNASGVSLTLDGEAVDIQPHVRGDRTARFDLEG
ncbi:helix-turn-helix domain-containing protein [Thioalkalivibrio sp. ALJ7]|uniref:helix-turn-helix domain-containing protein n=1 Tax=Thioalkalivibrio sp. ALJ7 TaxID=1158756 RepID=UPI00035C1548|nr:helix-turn-helix domain-containing protein [Thioalkalivibrio sp. ALJ7]